MAGERTHDVVDSPVGPLTLVADRDDDGAWALAALYMTEHRHAPAADTFGPRGTAPVLDAAREQVGGYFDGTLTDFDLPTGAAGTPFQQEVWRALATIPYGDTWSYGDLATTLGRPGASRAVGLANGRNPVSIVVPCHRVVGATGALTGYGGGVERKRFLLELEARHRPWGSAG